MNRIHSFINLLVMLMIPLVIAALILGIARTFLDLRAVVGSPGIGKAFDLMVSNILAAFIVVELLRTVLDYFSVHRLKITYIIDAAIVFVLREVMIGLYGHAIAWQEITALALLLLVLGGVRTLAVLYSPKQEREVPLHE